MVQGKVRQRSKDVLINGQLFVETALVTVKQNSGLLCHSQLDDSQGCVAIICKYQILVTEYVTVSDIMKWPS